MAAKSTQLSVLAKNTPNIKLVRSNSIHYNLPGTL